MVLRVGRRAAVRSSPRSTRLIPRIQDARLLAQRAGTYIAGACVLHDRLSL